MFVRTPADKTRHGAGAAKSPDNDDKAGPSDSSKVRRSIGEWEAGKTDPSTKAPLNPAPAKSKPQALGQGAKTTARRESVETAGAPPAKQYASRVAEARACLSRAKFHLNNSRNLKTEIKAEVSLAIERLYQLVKEAEAENEGKKGEREALEKDPVRETDKEDSGTNERIENERREFERKMKERDDSMNERCMDMKKELYSKMEEQGKMIKESRNRMEKIQELLERRQEVPEGTTYASVAAGRAKAPTQAALHSVVVSSSNIEDSGEEILEQIREVVKAKDGWVKIERVRKAKGKKVILGCESEEERMKVKERLKGAKKLLVEDVKNKDPLLVLRDVLHLNDDEEIASALRNQNRFIFEGLREEDDRLEFRFRRRTRNPHASHVVMRVSPAIWSRMVGAGALHVDLQRVKVADYSPLVQCSICLGYGHGRRFCTETVPKCSHCGGPHMRDKCASYLASVAPSCSNCTRAKLELTEHNAFSQDCPIRRKWDALARSSIAYS